MSDEKFKQVIEKIKKCFALSKSDNENEAALALENARRMMLKYNIEQSDLVKNDVEDIEEIDFELASKFNTPATQLAYWVGKAFMVRPIIMKNKTGYHKVSSKIRFIGATSDLSAGTYIWSYLLNIIENKSQEYYLSVKHTKAKWAPLEAKKVKSDYAYGFVVSLSEKLKAMEEERKVKNPYEEQISNALVVVKDSLITKYINDSLGKLKTQKSSITYNKNHMEAGYSEGERTGIHKGVGSSNTQKSIGGRK